MPSSNVEYSYIFGVKLRVGFDQSRARGFTVCVMFFVDGVLCEFALVLVMTTPLQLACYYDLKHPQVGWHQLQTLLTQYGLPLGRKVVTSGNEGQRDWGALFWTLLVMAIVVRCALYGAHFLTKAWLKKHKRMLLITAGLIGGGVAVYHGLQSLGLIFRSPRVDSSVQTAVSEEVEDSAEARLQSHFESIQRISETTTLPSVLPQLKASLFAQVDLSGLTEKLMLGKQDPQALSSRDKMQLWQELKTLSFTRTVCAMWAISLLDIFIHIQLNILGKHVYFDTAKHMSKSKEVHVPLSLSCQKKFIAFAGYLPHKGLQLLVTDTHEAVDIVLKGKDLKEACTIDDLRDVFMKIRATIDSRQQGWDQYVLPAENALPDGLATAYSALDIGADAPPDNDLFDDREELAQLMIETRAVLASNEFQEVLAVCLDAILDGVMEEVNSVYRGAPDHGIPLAKLLPPIAGSGITLLNHPDENRFLQILATLPQVQSFCALVYTTTNEEAVEGS